MLERNEISPRLLLVDDDALMARVLRLALSALYDVSEAASLAEARPLLEAGGYDVVLLDCALPDGLGLELIAPALECNPQAAVLVVSGETEASIVMRAIRAGAHDYVIKGERLLQDLLLRIPMAIERAKSAGRSPSSVTVALPEKFGEIGSMGYRSYLNTAEKVYLERALELCRFEVSTVAKAIGLSRSTVHKRLAELGLGRRSDVTVTESSSL